MKNALQITLKDKSVITLDVIVKTTYETTIKVDELLEPGNLPLFLSIQHKQLNTLLELSKVSPFVLLYFDEYNFFTGASFSINGDKSQFSIQSQSKNIVLHPFPVPFELNQVFELSYKLIENDNDNRNSDHRSFEHRAFTKGYGQFPYVILKTGNALFMQIPIHFNKNNDIENYPGTHINEISKTVLDNYEIDKSSELHEVLIEHCKWMQNRIDSKIKEPSKICLVESPEIAYYFDGNKVTFSSIIPNGGTLLSQKNKIIAMNVSHYL